MAKNIQNIGISLGFWLIKENDISNTRGNFYYCTTIFFNGDFKYQLQFTNYTRRPECKKSVSPYLAKWS